MESKQRANLQPSTQLISSDVRILKQAGPGNYLIKPAFNLMHAEGLCLEGSANDKLPQGAVETVSSFRNSGFLISNSGAAVLLEYIHNGSFSCFFRVLFCLAEKLLTG